jgi:hypothetical protein
MPSKEAAPISQKETLGDKIKNIATKVLVIGTVIGVGYAALKSVIPWLGKQIDKIKGIIK